MELKTNRWWILTSVNPDYSDQIASVCPVWSRSWRNNSGRGLNILNFGGTGKHKKMLLPETSGQLF